MKYKNNFRIFFFFTLRKITVVGFVNQLIKKFWPYSSNVRVRRMVRADLDDMPGSMAFQDVTFYLF